DRRRRGKPSSSRPVDDGARKPQRPREAYPHGTAPRGRAEDPRRTEPGLRRQSRAYPANRGPRIREVAGGASEASRRAAPASGGLALLVGDLRRALGEFLALPLLFRTVLNLIVRRNIVRSPCTPLAQGLRRAGGAVDRRLVLDLAVELGADN